MAASVPRGDLTSEILMPRFIITAYMRAPSAPVIFSSAFFADSLPSMIRVSISLSSAASSSRATFAACCVSSARPRKCAACSATFAIALSTLTDSACNIFTAVLTWRARACEELWDL